MSEKRGGRKEGGCGQGATKAGGQKQKKKKWEGRGGPRNFKKSPARIRRTALLRSGGRIRRRTRRTKRRGARTAGRYTFRSMGINKGKRQLPYRGGAAQLNSQVSVCVHSLEYAHAFARVRACMYLYTCMCASMYVRVRVRVYARGQR